MKATSSSRGDCMLRLICCMLKLFMWLFVAVILSVAAVWLYFRFATDVLFASAVRDADRIVIRDGGGTCHSRPDMEPTFCEITDRAEIAAFIDMFRFSGRSLKCRCCGYPGVDWWRDGKRFAVAALHHGQALRVDGFIFDLCLTEESRSRIKEWLKSHCGIAESEDSPRYRRCEYERRRIESEAYGEAKKSGGRPTMDDLRVRFEKDGRKFPSCPSGGEYALSYDENGRPVVGCSAPGHIDK